MDRLQHVATPNPLLQTRPVEPAPRSAVLVDIAVLSGDTTLFETLKSAVGEQNPVWRARSAEETVDLLLSGRCGVLLVDMAAVSTQPATLIEQIVEQFPDVVVVVAGRRDDEALLARLISDGLVYRFIHKPATPKRAGMFLTAAIRHHLERRDSRPRAPVLRLPLTGMFRKRRFEAGKWLFVVAGLAAFIGLLGLLADGAPPEPEPAEVVATPPPPKPAALPAPQADPVLSRARAALDAGRLESPRGRNALDLFHAVLLVEPDQPEARAGLAQTIKAILEQANDLHDAGSKAEARRLVERVRGVDASNPGVALFDAKTKLQRKPSKEAAQETPVSGPAVTPSRRSEPVVTKYTKQQLAPYPMPSTPTRSIPKRRKISYGAPAASGHEIAGYERTVAAAPQAAIGASDVAATTLPPVPAEPIVDAFQAGDGAPINRDVELISSAVPAYPADALAQRLEGWVEVEFTVTETGEVAAPSVADSEPSGVFEQAALESVATSRYEPRLLNGKPVAHRTSTTVRFTLEQ
jgi:protein TonB